MRKLLAARWFWITAVFAVINITGFAVLISMMARPAAKKPLKLGHEPLVLEEVHQADLTPERELILTFVFSDMVDPADLKEHLALTAADGKPLPYAVETDQPQPRLSVRIEVIVGDALTAKIAKGLMGMVRKTALAEDIVETVKLDTEIKITSCEAQIRDRDQIGIGVEFSRGIDSKTAQDFIRIEPPLSYTVSTEFSQIQIAGLFAPRKKYKVQILKGLKGISGTQLRKDFARTLIMPDRPPTLRFKTRGIYLFRSTPRSRSNNSDLTRSSNRFAI